MSFADKLKEILNKNGLKAADLARSTGLSEAAISDYLKGKKEPRGRQSITIAKALNVSLDTLWETEYDNTNSNDPKTDAPDLSPTKKRLIAEIEKMSEPELDAIKVFIDSLDEYKKALGVPDEG